MLRAEDIRCLASEHDEIDGQGALDDSSLHRPGAEDPQAYSRPQTFLPGYMDGNGNGMNAAVSRHRKEVYIPASTMSTAVANFYKGLYDLGTTANNHHIGSPTFNPEAPLNFLQRSVPELLRMYGHEAMVDEYQTGNLDIPCREMGERLTEEFVDGRAYEDRIRQRTSQTIRGMETTSEGLKSFPRENERMRNPVRNVTRDHKSGIWQPSSPEFRQRFRPLSNNRFNRNRDFRQVGALKNGNRLRDGTQVSTTSEDCQSIMPSVEDDVDGHPYDFDPNIAPPLGCSQLPLLHTRINERIRGRSPPSISFGLSQVFTYVKVGLITFLLSCICRGVSHYLSSVAAEYNGN